MGKGRDRGPKRRGFDDEQFTPSYSDSRDRRPSQPAYRAPSRSGGMDAPGEVVDATVKWFNTEKGFGFVELGDGSGDAFLHIGVVQAAGHDDVTPETKLRVQVGQGQKGRQVTAITEVGAIGTGSSAPPRRSPSSSSSAPPRRSSDRERVDPASASPLEGSVKWFKGEKGFGFVGADDGGKDVFIHISVLERAGINALAEGQRVGMRVVSTQKGREAISIELLD